MSTYLGTALKRRLYPTVFCYHGCVLHRTDVLTFRQAIGDVHAHVRMMVKAGYTILKPSEYADWQAGLVEYDTPVTCLHFDDGLASIELVIPWLIEQGIPCGLALITRRLRKVDSEADFVRWAQLNEWVNSGLVELMNHTHNMHHLTLVRTDGILDVAPVLEGPCYIDDGDVVYQPASETRWYWDFSQLDEIALAIPLWGTDQYDSTTPIVTTLFVTPKTTGTVTLLRFWMALSRPFSGGYDAQVEIRADGVLVWSGTVEPKDYSTRSQWVEREFYSIELDSSFGIVNGVQVELEFTTLNAGDSLALLYAIPTTDDTDFYAVSSCVGLYPAGSQGDRSWQYIDYPPGERYPMVPCIIMGFGTGADATIPDYEAYVEADCIAHDNAVANWLTAEWVPVEVWRTFSTVGPANPIGWNNPNHVSTVLPIEMDTTRVVEAFRFEIGGTENFQGGDADEEAYGRPGNPSSDSQIAEALGRSYTATFRLLIGDSGSGPFVEIGRGQIYEWQRGRASDVDAFTLTANVAKYLKIETVNGGWLSGQEQKCRWPVWSVTALCRVPGAPAADPVTQIVYPFGSYFSSGEGVLQQRPGFKDIGPELKALLLARSYTHGYTIQGFRNVVTTEFREPDLRQTEWALGRWIVYGDQAPAVSQNNLAALSGMLFQDVPHRGVQWQASLEYDPQGNATIKARPHVLDFVAFDAYGFDGAGGIVPQTINTADKDWLQARGVKCLLIINNNLGTGEPDPAIGAHVVNNAATYIPLIVALAVDDNWEGITCNLEAVPSADRAAATAFYADLARAMHTAGKLLHATVPAATGTDYDADFWTGWCDHLEIVRVCDAIKVMSYTETGPGTDPGPAAPQDFWDLVYARLRQIIPEFFWPRVLCGCRTFGHIWNSIDSSVEYITYHQGIAQALDNAKRIDIRDTEGGWGSANLRAWFGTPATVDRAQREAALNFGGIGLWKLDDGDIEECFPNVRQIGRDERMDFMDTRFPLELSFGSSGGPNFSTGVLNMKSGNDVRNSYWEMPRHEYDASLAVQLPEHLTAVRNLFMAARGQWRSFRFKDFSDFRGIGEQIGLSDGVLTTFQLVRTYEVDGYSLVREITKVVSNTTRVYRNGVEYMSGWTVNLLTGLVSFTVPPTAGGIITADFEFDVPVRFNTDRLPTTILARSGENFVFSPGTVQLIEDRNA